MRIFYWLVVVALAFVLVLLVRTALFTSRQIQPRPIQLPPIDAAEVAEILAGAIRIPTVTYQDVERTETSALEAFATYLEAAFPAVHDVLERDTLREPSLLYTWEGRDRSLDPVVLTAHFDVVPADSSGWTYPPFEGRITGGHVWGRGTLDDKQAIISMMTAVENLITSGFTPERTVYLAFGHDEERGGHRGAAQMARALQERGAAAYFVLDEGLPITRGVVPGIDRAVALVAIAEKGLATLEMTAHVNGGHSSMPPSKTAIGAVSRAVARLESRPMPARLHGVVRTMFEYLGPEMSFLNRVAFANLWLFRPFVERRLASAPSTNALLRTTTAPTIIQGGFKENILPDEAKAVINFRIVPGDSVTGVVDHARRTVDDSTITMRILPGSAGASTVSPSEDSAFRLIHEAIGEVFGDVIVAPALMIARSDARHYEELTTNVYRFSPSLLNSDEIGRIHGTDERISVQNLVQTVQFYHRLIVGAAGRSDG